MSKESKRHPSIPAMHPGESLREIHFPALDKSLDQIAADLHVRLDELEAVLAEQRPVTAELALKLSKYMGASAEFWLRLQNSYDLWEARQTVDVSGIEKVRVDAAE